MVKHTLTIPTNCLSVFDHFVGLALKGLKICPVLVKKDASNLFRNVPLEHYLLNLIRLLSYTTAINHCHHKCSEGNSIASNNRSEIGRHDS